MRNMILAVINPDNTPHGYNWTFAFPMLLFIFSAIVLYLLFSRPHRRVPARPIGAASSRAPQAGAARSATASTAAPETPEQSGDSTEAEE